MILGSVDATTRFFSSHDPKAFQAYMNFWYAQTQAQAQAQTGQG